MYPSIRISTLNIPSFFAMIAFGFIVAGIFLWKAFQKSTLSYKHKWVWVLIIAFSVPAAMIGTHIDEYLPFLLRYIISSESISTIENILSLTSGWFNGFILSAITILILLKLLKVPILYVCDLASPSIAIGQVFGRIGCFLAGDGCYGRATDLPWGMAFPDGVVPISIPVHPTPLYEASLLLLIFIVLWRLRHRGLPEGTTIALYLVLSGTERFFVEFIRLNAKLMFSLTAPQIFSLIFIIIGSRMLYLRRNEIRVIMFSSPSTSETVQLS